MASLDFPTNPVDGDTYTLNGASYYYNASMGAWLTQVITPPILSSTNNQVMFNYAGQAIGSNGLTFSTSSNTVFANSVNVTTMVVTGNLQIGTGTTTISGSSINVSSLAAASSNLSTLNVSGNIYTTGSSSSVSTKQVKSNYYTPKDISYVSHSGYNAFLMIVDGKLYSCHGTQGSWASYQTGRYDQASYQADWGFEGLRRVMFPYETTAKVVQADLVGNYNAWALFDNGNLYTWGYNNYGTCGLGDTSQRYSPQLAATNVTAVYGNGYLTSQSNYTAARLFIKKSDGYIYGCGYNGYGALGFGDTTDRSSFTQISSLGTSCKYIWNVGSNYGATYAILNDNSIYVCGYNGYGQFGNGGTSNYYSFIDVTSYFNPSKYDVVKIFGEWSNYCTIGILLSNGDLYTCGYNGNYAIGNGGSSTIYSPYKVMTGVTNAWSIGAGNAPTMFAQKGSDLYVWGYNGYGQCGINGTTSISTPTVTISGAFSDFMNSESQDQTYPTYNTAIVRKTDGHLYSAGWGGYGECGIGSVSNSNTGWNRVLLPGDFYPTKVGSYCTTGTTREYIAVGSDNTMYAWGYNGQYGVHNNNIAQTISVPMQIFMRLGG